MRRVHRSPRAVCDRCGGFYPRPRLRREARTGLIVCPRCHDDEHPQERPRLPPLDDPRPIPNPRPAKKTGGE